MSYEHRTSLRLAPSGKSEQKEIRYLDIYEDQPFDEDRLTWLEQASELPCERM